MLLKTLLIISPLDVMKAPGFVPVVSGENSAEGIDLQPEGIPLVVIADDSDFTAATLNNFLWVTFTRANPSHDLYGSAAAVVHKHWGCAGPLLIDARIKPHHAPPLETDPAISKKIDRLFGPGGDLHGLD